MDAATLAAWTVDARRRTLELYADRRGEQLAVPRIPIVNPPGWELGHVAWFQEVWVLRRTLGRAPLFARGDELWDSAKVAHATRWGLDLPSEEATRRYLEDTRDQVVEALHAAGEGLSDALRYFAALSVFHEDMHGEAFLMTRQTLGWPAPTLTEAVVSGTEELAAGPHSGDVTVPGGTWRLGAEPTEAFVFDNEKWAHDNVLAPFRIARAPVTQAEFVSFVEDGGYARRELWSDAGWAWRGESGAEHPFHWRRGADGWERRVFDRWVTITSQPHRPAIHIGAHEAEAWCKWAGRRLPTEAEWERAAAGAPIDHRANLDTRIGDTVDVAAFPSGDSDVGCRQMTGNVWEWTSTSFGPYPGFVRDPYAEYSEPWFGDHRVLRGGCFATRRRLLRPTWRNFYRPERRDVWAGFRTCALD